MEEVISRCGYHCDLCLAYRPNVENNPSNQQKLSEGWYAYFGFRIQPEDIFCDGCMSAQGNLIDKHCPVRPCVIEKGLSNCSACEQYACEKLNDRMVDGEQIRIRIGRDIPEDDYVNFIQPYENRPRLDALRATGEI